MRAILAIIGLAAVALVAAISLGMVSINTSSGNLPTIKFEGGKPPAVEANVGHVGLGTSNHTIELPTVTMTNKTIAVPTIEVERAPDAPAPAEK